MYFNCKAVTWQILANTQGSSFPVSFNFSCDGKIIFLCWSLELDLADIQVNQPTIKLSSTFGRSRFMSTVFQP